MHALQVDVCSLGHEPFPSAFDGPTLHLEAKPACPAHAELEAFVMLGKDAPWISQSALGYVLAVVAMAERLSEVVPGCVAARSLQPCMGVEVLRRAVCMVVGGWVPWGCAWAVAARGAMRMEWAAADEGHWEGVGQPLERPLLQPLSQSMSRRQRPTAVTWTLTSSRQYTLTIHDHH